MDDQQRAAIEAYKKTMGIDFVPGEVVELPIDALVFNSYQPVWTDLESYRKQRCNYDDETNEWLEDMVREYLLEPHIPPIYVDILPDGVAVVDGVHRVSAHLIAGHTTILAQLNKE